MASVLAVVAGDVAGVVEAGAGGVSGDWAASGLTSRARNRNSRAISLTGSVIDEKERYVS